MLSGGLAVALMAPLQNASATTFHTLHRFCKIRSYCPDGALPEGLSSDQSGNIYGTTSQGGNNSNSGVLFKLTPNEKGGYSFNVLYQFCEYHNCPDGENPEGPPIIDTAGNLYGTTSLGGANASGAIYELSPGGGGQWTEKVLYSFCSQANCVDGSPPSSTLTYTGEASGAPYDGTSPLYGSAGGGEKRGGTVFSLQPSNGSWTEQTLYSFVYPGGPSELNLDSGGNIYGALGQGGGRGKSGSIFKLSASGSTWTKTTLYSFCAKCSNGANPEGKLYIDGSGDIWGTTYAGGATKCRNRKGCGTIFELVPGQGTYTETTVHTFCEKMGCKDGYNPAGTLQPDADGNLFGTTLQGGDGGGGVLFELTGTSYKVLHQFCIGFCHDGDQPMGYLVLTSTGQTIGVTSSGAGDVDGSIYEVTR